MANKDFDVNQYIQSNSEGSDANEAPKKDSFSPDEYIASNSEHLESDQPKPEQWSKAESLGQGVLQGATLGYSDEIGGALGALMEKAADAVGKGPKSGKSLKDLYKEYRDFQRQRNKAAEDSNKKTYIAGNVAGGVGGALLAPGLLAAKSIPAMGAIGAATGLGSSEADLTDPSVENLKQAGKDVAVGGALGVGAGVLGSGIKKLLTPKNLEVAGSKLASSSVGLKPTKELAEEFSQETGKVIKGSDIIKGIGKTAVEEGALPTTGGAGSIYDKSIEAIENNYKKLNPLIPKIQSQLDEDLAGNVSKIGAVEDKVAEFADQFTNKIPETSRSEDLTNKLFKVFSSYKDKLAQNEGNLEGLLKVKRELQDAASSLTKNIYTDPNASEKLTEAQFLKQLGGIVRQHTEDLAATVDQQGAEQLGSINKTLSNLYTYKDAARKLLDKPTASVGWKDVAVGAGSAALGHPVIGPALVAGKYVAEKAIGQPLGQFGKILGAKATLGAAKALSTPAGELIQKVVPEAVKKAVVSPFSQEGLQSGSNQESTNAQATELSSNLYNATDDSLKQVADSFTKSNGPVAAYGNQLKKAIQTKDEDLKNRTIFAIMQNPQARKLITPQE